MGWGGSAVGRWVVDVCKSLRASRARCLHVCFADGACSSVWFNRVLTRAMRGSDGAALGK
eukprot:967985-Alexandrium_andersonii.AAC.1